MTFIVTKVRKKKSVIHYKKKLHYRHKTATALSECVFSGRLENRTVTMQLYFPKVAYQQFSTHWD